MDGKEEKEKEIKKEPVGRLTRKQAAPRGYSKIENTGRCAGCTKEGKPCEVDMVALARWREDMAVRKAVKPVVCWGCKQRK